MVALEAGVHDHLIWSAAGDRLVGGPGLASRAASAAHIWITVLLVSAYSSTHPQGDASDLVIACEQYVNRTIVVPNTKTYLYYLRPDRDSDAGPTA